MRSTCHLLPTMCCRGARAPSAPAVLSVVLARGTSSRVQFWRLPEAVVECVNDCHACTLHPQAIAVRMRPEAAAAPAAPTPTTHARCPLIHASPQHTQGEGRQRQVRAAAKRSDPPPRITNNSPIPLFTEMMSLLSMHVCPMARAVSLPCRPTPHGAHTAAIRTHTNATQQAPTPRARSRQAAAEAEAGAAAEAQAPGATGSWGAARHARAASSL